MKTTRLLLTAALLAASAPASAALDLRRAEVTHLPNGLTVILLEDHSRPLVSVQTLYKSGSAAEKTGKTGLAHFLEHLVFRGSQNFPKGRATDLIYDAGGEWHGYTAMDQTTYFSTMPKDQLDLLLKIEADRMARTVIDPASIEAEKGAVITELHSYENNPASVLQEAVTRTAIQAHPYGSPMAGYVSDVERLTIDDARAYYASHYAPANAVLAIVGDFDVAQARDLVAKAFADVRARPAAEANLTVEPPQGGTRRITLGGFVDRQYFQLAFPAPAASSPDFPVFMVLQEILSGGSGLNLHQGDWAPTTPSVSGSLLFGATDDLASWLAPTRDPFLFIIAGSIPAKTDSATLERDINRHIATLRTTALSPARLAAAKSAVTRQVAEDIPTTEEAAHQLAFFEGVGAFDQLLDMPRLINAVTANDIRRVASSYLNPASMAVGWMGPGEWAAAMKMPGEPQAAADRPGMPSTTGPAPQPRLRRLSGGLPAIVQANPLSNTATVELLLSAPSADASHPEELPGLDAILRSGTPSELATLASEAAAASRKPRVAEPRSDDPVTRLEQLVVAQTSRRTGSPAPLAVIVSGNVDPDKAFAALETTLGKTVAGTLAGPKPAAPSAPTTIRDRIAKPLSQGGIGYVVQAPPPGTREAAAWRMLLYVLTHDYSGRLGQSAITDKGLVYYIGSALRTDGSTSWATIAIGVDPDKADAMESELRAQLTRLVTQPPSQVEVDAARSHLLGRDVTAAQTNEELTAKLARAFVETGGLRTHEQLRAQLQSITPADLAAAAQAFGQGTIIRVDVGAAPR